MAFTFEIAWEEGPLKITNNHGEVELRGYLFGDDPSEDRVDALAALTAQAPTDLYGFQPRNYDVLELLEDVDNAAYQAKKYRCKVKYANPELIPPPPWKVNDVKVSVRATAGGSLNQLYALNLGGPNNGVVAEIADIDSFKWSQNAELARTLGWEADDDKDTGTVFTPKGIQRATGGVEIGIEVKLSDASVSASNYAYLLNAALHVGRNDINSVAYRGFPSGSLKLISMDAQQESGNSADTINNTGDWMISYTMAFSPPLTAAELNKMKPPGLTADFAVGKRGWEYLDVLYSNSEVTLPNTPFKWVLPVGRRAAIQRVLFEVDFASILQI